MISCLIFQLVPQIITLEIQICNCQELDMNLPRYQLISTLNETSPEIMEMAKNAHNLFLLITSEKILWMGTGTRVKIQIIVTHATINIVMCM